VIEHPLVRQVVGVVTAGVKDADGQPSGSSADVRAASYQTLDAPP